MYDQHLQRTISWVSGWAGPWEGAMSLLMKFAWTNVYDNERTLQTVFIGNRTKRTNKVLGFRSFIDFCWARRTNWVPNFLGQRIIADSLCEHRWWTAIAGDEKMRYCSACASVGYQSNLFQIEALHSCPMHGHKLLSACVYCHEPTAAYGHSETQFAKALYCAKCGLPYGAEMKPTAWAVTAHHALALDRLAPIIRWINESDNLLLESGTTDEIFGNWLPSQELSERRVQIFSKLNTMCRSVGDPSIFTILTSSHPLFQPASKIRVQKPLSRQCVASRSFTYGRLWIRNHFGFPQFSNAKNSNEAEDCTSVEIHRFRIYKSIRRHIFRTINGRSILPKLDAMNLNNTFHAVTISHVGAEQISLTEIIGIWRLQFELLENRTSNDSPIRLRCNSASLSRVNTRNDALWGEYIFAMLCEIFSISRLLKRPSPVGILDIIRMITQWEAEQRLRFGQPSIQIYERSSFGSDKVSGY